jgi:dTDP-glucose 4,6-dehydratase
MRVLLTGISGFMGSHLMEHLLVKTEWDIVGIASWQHKGVPERIADSEHYQAHKERVEIITHDLNAPIPAFTRERIGQVDYIINCAADSHVDRSITDPVPFIQNNVSVVLNMLELARAIKPKAFVQIGTDESYGPMFDQPHKEWSAILPSNPYSGSKAAQEAIAISYWRTYGVPLILTNTMNLFAERQDAEKFVPSTIRKVLTGQTVTIHGTANNIGSRFYIHARNQAAALLFILKHLPA